MHNDVGIGSSLGQQICYSWYQPIHSGVQYLWSLPLCSSAAATKGFHAHLIQSARSRSHFRQGEGPVILNGMVWQQFSGLRTSAKKVSLCAVCWTAQDLPWRGTRLSAGLRNSFVGVVLAGALAILRMGLGGRYPIWIRWMWRLSFFGTQADFVRQLIRALLPLSARFRSQKHLDTLWWVPCKQVHISDMQRCSQPWTTGDREFKQNDQLGTSNFRRSDA